MKSFYYLILSFLLVFNLMGQDFNITENIDSSLYYLDGNVQANPSTFHEVVIVTIDSCSFSQSALPAWFTQNYTKVHDFFDAATFENFNYAIDWLTKDANHAFIMPSLNIPKFDGLCEHVHSQANILDVLAQADAIYDFDNYDYDHNAIVEVHFASINIIGSHNGGVTNYPGSYCYSYTSNDLNSSGNNIIVRINRQSRGFNYNSYFGVFFHESGHSLFGFPDMDHSGINYFNHYAVGGFDVMSGGGFQGVPSLYNPWFRHARGWLTPTSITSNGTKILTDFQTTGQCYEYVPGSLPGNSIPNEKFYISYHFPDPTSQFYNTWPYKDRNLGGILIWHVKKDNPSIGDSYNDYRKLDIDIEAEHGKYVWQEYSDRVENTGIENALTGRDSLEIRKIVGGNEIQGPYYGKDEGSSSIFYTPDDGKNFTFYSNPNSNWYVNSSSEDYAQSITSGFSMKNLRNDNGTIKADFYTNDYTVTKDASLAAGKWYINSTITVGSGVTLTIASGATLKFASGKSLTVNGALNAINATFTSSSTNWSGIKFNSGSNGIIDGCEINNVQAYGGYAIAIVGASPTIQNCTIENNTIACGGISVSNNGSTIPYLYNNIIKNNTYHGIYIYNSAAYLRYNTITASTTTGRAAVYCDYYSTPLFAVPSGGYEEGKNTLQNGYYGLYGGYYSNINAGTSSNGYHN